jgi:hypothetical protein
VRQSPAIGIYHTEGQVVFDAIRNVIASANPGEPAIGLYQGGTGAGLTAARVVGNLLTGFGGGMRFGTDLYASGGTMFLGVLHNTIVNARLRAVQVGGRPDLDGAAFGLITNNVLAFSGRSDVGIHEFGDTVIERRNLLTFIDEHDAPSDPGPESLVVTDPQFAGPADFRLAATSPGVNTADPAVLPVDVTLDLDRRPRLAGPAPDMGAYELPCDPGSTEPHCVTPPTSCQATGCATDDPCFPALCLNDQGVPVELRGLERARCACERPLPASCASTPLPVPLTRKPAKACEQIGRAATSPSERQRARFLGNAHRAWEQAARAVVRRARKGTLAEECGTALEAACTDAAARIAYLLE